MCCDAPYLARMRPCKDPYAFYTGIENGTRELESPFCKSTKGFERSFLQKGVECIQDAKNLVCSKRPQFWCYCPPENPPNDLKNVRSAQRTLYPLHGAMCREPSMLCAERTVECAVCVV